MPTPGQSTVVLIRERMRVGKGQGHIRKEAVTTGEA